MPLPLLLRIHPTHRHAASGVRQGVGRRGGDIADAHTMLGDHGGSLEVLVEGCFDEGAETLTKTLGSAQHTRSLVRFAPGVCKHVRWLVCTFCLQTRWLVGLHLVFAVP